MVTICTMYSTRSETGEIQHADDAVEPGSICFMESWQHKMALFVVSQPSKINICIHVSMYMYTYICVYIYICKASSTPATNFAPLRPVHCMDPEADVASGKLRARYWKWP